MLALGVVPVAMPAFSFGDEATAAVAPATALSLPWEFDTYLQPLDAAARNAH
ncbi:hypothetical protein ABH922_000315 [Rhodococcus sp. 27YEA15]|uniref:hypothetical protein n=1 Tax=Rhodococcus sp. 27YEA15 TaxID=3156259 RepID=UPI003C7A18CE